MEFRPATQLERILWRAQVMNDGNADWLLNIYKETPREDRLGPDLYRERYEEFRREKLKG